MERPLTIGRAVAAAGLLAFFAATALAADYKRPDDEISGMVGFGFLDSDMVGPDKNGLGPVLDVRYGHEFSDAIGISTDLLLGPEYDGDSALFGDWSEISLGGGMDWFFAHTKRSTWFLTPGLGWSQFNPDQGENVSRGFVSLGIGEKFWPGDPGANLRWQFRLDQTVGSSGLDGDKVMTYKLLFGGSWGIGGPPPDSDEDGIPNRKDKCPDTPKGATVDEHGCPKDSDADTVFDGIDKCPDTPAAWPVDETGCPKDTDGDGVPDGKDKCADTPKGATVDADGCPKDADGDGVFDGLDKCADTPKGAKVGTDGCPLDADGDGVFDGLDQCPDTPKGAKVDAVGCPLPEKAPQLFTPEKRSLVLEGVNFENDSAALTPGSLAVLDTVAASLVDWPEVKVEVGGYTDSTGSNAYNQVLSEKRAQSVRDYLVTKGVDAARITVKGYGEADPIADNGTEAGRAKNRRVVLNRQD